MERDSFIFYKDWIEVLLGMPAELRLKVVDALLRYVQSGEMPTDPTVLYSPFGLMQKQLDRDAKKYETKCEKLRANAKKSRKKEDDSNCDQTPPSDSNCKQMQPNATKCDQAPAIDSNCHQIEGDNDNDNDNDNDISKGDILIKQSNPLKGARKIFVKPTIEEIQKYATERGMIIDPAAFFDYYESNGWKVGRTTMADWKATLRNWNRKERAPQTSTPTTHDHATTTTRPGSYAAAREAGDAEFARFASQKLNGSSMS